MNDAGEQILLHRIKSLEWLIDVKTEQVHRLETALKRIRDSEYVVYEKVRQIAREALEL
jgi:flagellar biosynthesis chaperone FliJ